MFCNHKPYLHRIFTFILVFCLLFSLSLFATSADATGRFGTTYYISDSLGNDENNGISEATPRKTIERLSQVSLTAGDTVLFKSGYVWYGIFELDVSSGTQDNPITFSSYGEGAKPSLCFYSGEATQTTEGICLRLLNANGFVMDGLAVGNANLGIKLYYDADHYESDYVRFTNCHFHDIYGVTQLDGLPEISFLLVLEPAWKIRNGLIPAMTKATVGPLRCLYIDNCTAYDAGSLVCGPIGVYGFYMTDCIAEECGYYGTTAFSC